MRAKVWAAIIICSLGWGTAGIATRAAFHEDVGPYTILGLRALIATAAVFAYRALRRQPWPSRRLWGLGAILGLTNYTGSALLFTLAVQYASAGVLGLLGANIPPVTAVWAHFLLRHEPLNPGKVAGLSLAVAGVGVLMATGESGLGEGGRPGLAILLAMAGVVVSAFGAVHARIYAPHLSVLDMVGPQLAMGAVVLVPLMVVIEGLPTGISAAGWGLIVYMALAGTFLPFLVFFWLLQRVGATTASLPSYLLPVVALTGGALLLGEQVTTLIGVGGALILAGVLFTERADRLPFPPGRGEEGRPAG